MEMRIPAAPSHCSKGGMADQRNLPASSPISISQPKKSKTKLAMMSLSQSGWPFWIKGFIRSSSKAGSSRASARDHQNGREEKDKEGPRRWPSKRPRRSEQKNREDQKNRPKLNQDLGRHSGHSSFMVRGGPPSTRRPRYPSSGRASSGSMIGMPSRIG
jgi:hypothetical protein